MMTRNEYKALDGKKAKIIANTSGHEFGIGEKVILKYDTSCSYDVKGVDAHGEYWWLDKRDFELIES